MPARHGEIKKPPANEMSTGGLILSLRPPSKGGPSAGLLGVLDRNLFHVEDDPIHVHVDLVELLQHRHDAALVVRPAPEDRPVRHAAHRHGQEQKSKQPK